jgi:lysozyme family protein
MAMADFLTAFKLTGHAEGGYVNNPDDHGGETYAGISRKNWTNWHGWIVVDAVKKETSDIHLINKSLNGAPSFQLMIQSFYKQNFWDVNKLDQINDQQIANAVYDFGVNAGVKTSAEKLQISCSVNPDGIIGPLTIKTINNGDAKEIYETFNVLREAYYNKLALKPGQHQFLASWLSRIKPYQIA